MLETALGLARRGFKVFPVKPGEKKPPLVHAWQNVATADEAQVRSWWAQWPQANVGVHCDGLLVIDVDPKKGGYESLTRLELEVDLPATYEVSTPSGGRHIYYRIAGGEQCRNGVDIFGPGLDIRTTAGYVIAAGCRTVVGEYRVLRDCDPAPAPAEIVARCLAPKIADRAVEAPQAVFETDENAAVERAKAHLRVHPVAIEGQGGDHHTFRTICRVRDFGVPEERAAETLGDWNSRCVPPWDRDELAIKIANAYAYAQDPAGKLTPEALGFAPIEAAAPASSSLQSGGKTPPAAKTMHPADVTLDEILASEYLIKGVLEKQSNAVLFGQWNVGKSFVVLDMAASIATGTKWFGKRVRAGRVLYLGYEGLRAMKKRMIALRDKYPALKDRKTPFEWAPLRAPLTRPDGVAELGALLVEFARRHGGAPDLIILDPLANALGGDDSDAAMMGALNECVAELMARQKCAVLRVHHSGHGDKDRARGHSSLPAGVDTEIRVTENEIALTKQRDDVRDRFMFKLDEKKLGKDSDGDDVTTCVVMQIEENALSPELPRLAREMLDALVEAHGDGAVVKQMHIKDASPNSTPAQRREMLRVLERKRYLRAEGTTWLIVERGPLDIFN